LRSPASTLAPDRVRRVLRRNARGAVPRRFEELVARLVAASPAERYPSASHALRDLGEIFGRAAVEAPVAAVARQRLPEAPLVGRDAALDALLQRLEALREGTLLEPLAVVAGPAGIGVTRLLATLRNHAAVSGCLVATGASLRDLASDLLGHPSVRDAGDVGATPREHVFRIDAALHALPVGELPVLILDDLHLMGEEESAALRDWIAALERRTGRAQTMLVLGGRVDGEGPGTEILRTAGRAVPHDLRDLAPLGRNEVRAVLGALLGQPRISGDLVQALHRATGGNPRLLAELMQVLVDEGVLDLAGDEPRLVEERLKGLDLPHGVAEAVARRVARLPAAAARSMARFALVAEPLHVGAALALCGADLSTLIGERLLAVDRGRVRFPSELTRRGADTLKGAARKKAMVETATALAREAPAAAALLYAEAGDLARAREVGLPAARQLRDARRHEEARRLLGALVVADADLELGRLLLDVLHAAGRWEEAGQAGKQLLARHADADVSFMTAAALRSAGHADQALALLEDLESGAAGDVATRVANAKAAVFESLGRYQEALAESHRAEAFAGTLLGLGGRIARVRAAILRSMRRRRAAEALVAQLALAPPGAVSGRDRAAAMHSRALLQSAGGAIVAPLRGLRLARALAAREGWDWGVAAADLDLGGCFVRCGRPDRAADRCGSVRREFSRLAHADVSWAMAEEALSLLRAGRPREAEQQLARIEELPVRVSHGTAAAMALAAKALSLHLRGQTAEGLRACDELLESVVAHSGLFARVAVQRAEIVAAQGDADEAEAVWRGALRRIAAARDRRHIQDARLGMAECAAARGAWRLAERRLGSRPAEFLALRTPLRARALLVRAGAALSRGEAGLGGRLLEQSIAVANRCTDAPLRAQVYATAASLLEEGELQRYLRQPTGPAAAALLEAARDIWAIYGNETMLRKIDLHLAELPRPATDPLAAPEADRLVKVLHVTREMNREFDRDRLLGLILDRAIELTGAERGFVILLDEGRETVHLARNLDREAISEPERKISSQIMKEVVRSGRIVRSENAETDGRFEEYVSVRQLHLKSIVAVPFRSGGKTVGALYLDNRFRTGSFSEQDERLLELFADQAVAAIDKSELVRELEGQRKELEELYKRQKSELQKRGKELTYAKRELRQHRQARGWSFEKITTRSVVMQGVVREAKRVAPTELSLIVWGENGTGKELIARAIHYASARQAMPFVALDCAAVAEGLYESELFGHVRGSFTGADRDRAGLFEEADGGTLFLDEIGNMPLAMQVKLLRALELGEVKRIGESAVRTVDVRVIAATNADLEQMIATGRFREDLYYRLAGLLLRVPPLRERLEDIEPLSYSFVEEAARREGRAEIKLTNDAIAKLESFPWPGNVRELRNVILRAVVSAEGKKIGPEDIKLDSRGPTLLPGYDPGQVDRILAEVGNRGFDLNHRQQTAINRVLARGKLLFGEYRELFRVSKSTTARDLELLVVPALLERRGKTRSAVYLPGPTLQEIARKVIDG
ncbi:MAG TPA: sigma 54-interacting transcriptional regulator, partial [Planctomycetota bacterium]|nr:sigma 54-interacting transcriptional regulator [Planctomycetota bacterium]